MQAPLPTDTALAELRELMLRHSRGHGTHATAMAGVRIHRFDHPGAPIHTIYESSVCVLAQGRKRVLMGEQVFDYGATRHLVASQDLPACGHILSASPQVPYLCLQMAIDPRAVAGLMLDLGDAFPAPPHVSRDHPAAGLYTEETTPTLLDATVRLLRLLDSPRDIEALGASVQREVLYRLLSSPNGWRLARCATPDSHDQRISRVISHLRERYREPLRIAALAKAGHMSESSLHQHFKAVTAMTPLQYQKQLRLQEARRLLVSEGVDAATAGFHVGYQSASQFSREYARLFGAPPLRDREQVLRQLQ